MLIVKADGTKEEFKKEKLEESLRASGAEEETIDYVVRHIVAETKDGDTTQEIYRHAYEILKKEGKKPVAARYSLKRAILELGPSGFPFESFLSELFRVKGYKTRTDVEILGKCAEHEVDVVAEKTDELMIIEAKFHNERDARTDLQVALYMRARYDDLIANKFDGLLKDGQNHRCAIFTNTNFTTNAYRYGECVGLEMVSWSRPTGGGLLNLIEETALHPLTALSTISAAEKNILLQSGKVLCQDIKGDESILQRLNLGQERITETKEEIAKLCVPRM